MLHPRGRAWLSLYALALLAAVASRADNHVRAQEAPAPVLAPSQQPPEPTPDSKAAETWSTLPEGSEADSEAGSTDNIVRFDQRPEDEPMADAFDGVWTKQWVPAGLIYHSYMAGPLEPRAGMTVFSNTKGGVYGDATLGGRMGFLKYGNCDPVHSEGWQLDFYGAAIARLDIENQQDLDSCDYVFGLPLTYGNEQLQFKFGYAHLSSHLGDEYAISHPGSLADRVNYVRDSLVFGTSYYPLPVWRVYGEVGWAFHHDGGAGPWDSQFGTELSRPGPTGDSFTPFLAVNCRVRDDIDVVGDVNFQAGWLRRGILGQTLRWGLSYYNGKSSQAQFFRNYEEQVGVGLWYDF